VELPPTIVARFTRSSLRERTGGGRAPVGPRPRPLFRDGSSARERRRRDS
jgi:hypothetical protein